MPSLRRTRLGPLDAVVLLPDGPTPPSLGVVLCHGFGAPGEDLVGLGPELLERHPELTGRVAFAFPSGPVDLASFGMPGGRAWWMLQMEHLAALQRGDPSVREQFRDSVPDGLAPARRALLGALEAFEQATGLPRSRMVLGGFSQGAMLTCDTALRLEEAPAALALLSGTLICESQWRAKAAGRAGLRVLQSHGRQDPILPLSLADALRALLSDAGLQVDFVPFEGGHTIPEPALARLGALLSSCAGA